jgi:putative hydrolase of HD superfamily
MGSAPSAEDIVRPVQQQLDAYNARDIERFMQCWADDCSYYAFPSGLLAQGTAQIRERHIERFKEPDLHGHLVNRMVVGNMVIDQEVVTRNFSEGIGEIDVIAMYEVEKDKIARAWFKLGPRRIEKSTGKTPA